VRLGNIYIETFCYVLKYDSITIVLIFVTSIIVNFIVTKCSVYGSRLCNLIVLSLTDFT